MPDVQLNDKIIPRSDKDGFVSIVTDRIVVEITDDFIYYKGKYTHDGKECTGAVGVTEFDKKAYVDMEYRKKIQFKQQLDDA